MKTERRHELQHNSLSDFLGQSIETAKPFSKTLVAVVVAVLVIAGTAWFLLNRSAAKRAQAWNEYFTAVNSPAANDELTALIDESPKAPAAQWARLYLADRAFDEGANLLFTDRSAADGKLRDALDNYNSVADSASEPALLERAYYGAAKTQESLNEIDAAISNYEKVVNDYPEGLFAPLAQARIDSLRRPATRDFYNWFAKFQPPPPATGPGQPGVKPEFESLPDSADAPSDLDLKLPAIDPAAPSGSSTTEQVDLETAPATEPTTSVEAAPAPASDVAPDAADAEPSTSTPAETPEAASSAEGSQETPATPSQQPPAGELE